MGGGVLIVKANVLDSIQLVEGMDVTKSSMRQTQTFILD